MTIASILSDLWMGGGAFEAPPGPGTPKTPRRNRVNVFVYWSDGLGDRAFDRHSRNGGAGHLPTKIARGAGHFTIFFKRPAFARRGGAMLAAGIDSHISIHVFVSLAVTCSDSKI